MKKEVNKYDIKELTSLAKHIGQVGGAPHLTKRQKKQMIAGIVPSQPLIRHLAPAIVAASFALVLVSSLSFVNAAQPGDFLYRIKRSIEDARSSVQPSYDNELIKRRDDEIKNIEAHGDNPHKIDIATKEKQEIEKRVKGRDTEDSNNTATKADASSTERRSGSDSTDTPKSQLDTSGEKSGYTTSGGSATTPSVKYQCKANLDARKQAGENINNDEYKKCDSL